MAVYFDRPSTASTGSTGSAGEMGAIRDRVTLTTTTKIGYSLACPVATRQWRIAGMSFYHPCHRAAGRRIAFPVSSSPPAQFGGLTTVSVADNAWALGNTRCGWCCYFFCGGRVMLSTSSAVSSSASVRSPRSTWPSAMTDSRTVRPSATAFLATLAAAS